MKNIRFDPTKLIRGIREAIDDLMDPVTKSREKVDKPKMFRVILHNSDDVDGHLVMRLLKSHFRKSDADAYRIVLAAHQTGSGTVGVYTKDEAETRTDAMIAEGLNEGYNIRMSVEEE